MKFLFTYVLLMCNLTSTFNFDKIKNKFFTEFLKDDDGKQELIILIDAILSEEYFTFGPFNNQSIVSESILYYSLSSLIFNFFKDDKLVIKNIQMISNNSNCFPCLKLMLMPDYYSNVKYNSIIKINDELSLSFYEIIRIYQYNIWYLMEINSFYNKHKNIISHLIREENKLVNELKNHKNLFDIQDILNCENFNDKEIKYKEVKQNLNGEVDKKLDEFYYLHVNNVKVNNIFNYDIKEIIDSLINCICYKGTLDDSKKNTKEIKKIFSDIEKKQNDSLKYIQNCMHLNFFEKSEYLRLFFLEFKKSYKYPEMIDEGKNFGYEFDTEIFDKLPNINMHSCFKFSDLHIKTKEIIALHHSFCKYVDLALIPNNFKVMKNLLKNPFLEEINLDDFDNPTFKFIIFLLENLAFSFSYNISLFNYKCFKLGISIIYNQDINKFDLLKNDICYDLDLAFCIAFEHKYLEYFHINNVYCHLGFIDVDKAHNLLNHCSNLLIGVQLAEIKVFLLKLNLDLFCKFYYNNFGFREFKFGFNISN